MTDLTVFGNESYFNEDSKFYKDIYVYGKIYTRSGELGETQVIQDIICPGTIPQNSQSSAYILTISDVGKHVSISTGGVTVPSGVFSAGDVVSVYNNSAFSQTITQGGSVTMYLVGTATTGNRTLAQRGVATILCVGTNTFVAMGGGLT